MKKMRILIPVTIVLLITSCVTSSYYQVYKVNADEKVVQKQNSLIFEDDNCIVSYNLWEQNGSIGFDIYNKSNHDMYINKEKCFFILNGFANQYYKNRTFTKSTNIGVSNASGISASKSVTGINYSGFIQTNKVLASSTGSTSTSSGYAVSYNEEKFEVIPSKTSKRITEFSINDKLYRDCGLFKYPNSRQIKTISFNESDSPLIFSNRINYSLSNSAESISLENTFYVSEITNYSTNDMFEYKYDEYCGQKSIEKTKYFKEYGPDKFYIKYSKGTDAWKH